MTSPRHHDAEFPPVGKPKTSYVEASNTRRGSLLAPTGSLGKLEELANWVAERQGCCPPRPFTRPRVVIFAGDHGISQRGVSAYPPEMTAVLAKNFLSGQAAIGVLAGVAGATVRLLDMSIDADISGQAAKYKVRRGSGSIDREDALSKDETLAAIAAGRAVANEEIDSGTDILIAGDMGVGSTTAASVLIAALTGQEPVAVVGRGSGVDDHGWIHKTAAIRDALYRARKVLGDPVELLSTAGGADIAALAGFLAQAAVRRTPVLLDDVVVGAAALVAEELAPGARDWWLAGHRSTEPAHTFVLTHLGLSPLLDLGMSLGEGSGAVAALPLVTMAVNTVAHLSGAANTGQALADPSQPAV